MLKLHSSVEPTVYMRVMGTDTAGWAMSIRVMMISRVSIRIRSTVKTAGER
jgi:hypothetical protein